MRPPGPPPMMAIWLVGMVERLKGAYLRRALLGLHIYVDELNAHLLGGK